MKILPALLYLFRTLPFKLDPKQMQIWENSMCRFIFGGKRARIAKAILQKPSQEGGWGYPSFTMYYEACQLHRVAAYIHPHPPKWVEMELDGSGILPSTTYLLSNKLPPGSNSAPNPMLSCTLKVWGKWQKKLIQIPSPLATLSSLPDAPAVISKSQWAKLSIAGYRTIREFRQKRFQDLSIVDINQMLDLTASHWIEAMALRNFVSHLAKETWCNRSLTMLEKALLEQSPQEKGHLSRIYRILLETTKPPLQNIKQLWETDCAIQLDADSWDAIPSTLYSSHKSQANRELSLKVLYRWYRTPVLISKIHKGSSPYCWHGCGQLGSYIHMWWSCPVVAKFWGFVQKTISHTLNKQLILTPALVFLFLFVNEHEKLAQRDIIKSLVTAAKLEIAAHWKTANQLNNESWLLRVRALILNELIDSQLGKMAGSQTQPKTVAKWSPFIQTAQENNWLSSLFPAQDSFQYGRLRQDFTFLPSL